jgi:hypothetical protein
MKMVPTMGRTFMPSLVLERTHETSVREVAGDVFLEREGQADAVQRGPDAAGIGASPKLGTPQNVTSAIRTCFSVGNTVDPAVAYRAFRERGAGIEALMRKRRLPLPAKPGRGAPPVPKARL